MSSMQWGNMETLKDNTCASTIHWFYGPRLPCSKMPSCNTAAGVVLCGGPRKSPRTSSIVQIIFSVWSIEIREGILRNQKIIIGLHSFSNKRLIYIWSHLDCTSLCIDYPVERCKITVILLGSMLPNL